MNELLTFSGLRIGRLIKEGKLTPTEAVEVHIRRIEEVNPLLNAVVNPFFDEAREQAREMEKSLRRKKKDRLPPLFGVPCTVKETYAVEGTPWTGGVAARRGVRADRDAALVSILKKQGAIILGTTNVPEAAMWMETYNKIHGLTRNPYDPSRTVGGSSGGEGAIIGAGGSPFGLGSDVGGSIRYPTVFNGIVGHKPTGGLTDGAGNWPESEGPVRRYCTYGPMARRMEDVVHLMQLFAKGKGRPGMRDPDKVDLSKVRVFHFGDNGTPLARASEEVKKAVADGAAALTDRCAGATPWRPEGMKGGLKAWSSMMALGQETPFAETLGNGAAINVPMELLKFLLRRSEITGPGLALAVADSLLGRFRSGLKEGVEIGRKLQERIERKLGDDGVLLCPVFSRAAPKHHHPWLYLFSISYSAPFNVLEFPATIVPIFRNDAGLPVGLQVVGGRGMDHLTLAVGRELERIFGGWRPPGN